MRPGPVAVSSAAAAVGSRGEFLELRGRQLRDDLDRIGIGACSVLRLRLVPDRLARLPQPVQLDTQECRYGHDRARCHRSRYLDNADHL
ncbi:hypothetical protein ACIQVK_25440 [Streptomyces sp. NPDC090493]|uniref:hypothetical protein n=1 Tax=Streptomyces sp. NPDC090493 TaxID=3365964 RepID=UPI003828DB21